MKNRVVVLGDVNIDLILSRLTHIPLAEQETLAPEMDMVVGGQASTIARGLANLGLKVSFVGRVGDDDYGRQAVAQLEQDGIDTSCIVIDPHARTGLTVVLSTGTERAYATYLGTLSRIEHGDIKPELLTRADHFHVGSYFMHKSLHSDIVPLFAELKRHGLTVSVDPGWDLFGEWNGRILEALDYVDVLMPNQVEALRITRASSVLDALDRLAGHARIVVIKMGQEGCFVKSDATRFACSAFDVAVLDVTSAGDIFNAGFVYGLMNQWDLEHTARFANACGAIAVTRVGSRGLISSVAQVDEFLCAHVNKSGGAVSQV